MAQEKLWLIHYAYDETQMDKISTWGPFAYMD